MMFIGIDLAWSPRNPSGGAAIRGDVLAGTLVDHVLLDSDASILAFIDAHAPDGPCIVGIDAPLWVPNQSGRRPGEAALAASFQRYEAGAHPANRRLLARNGVIRGEALVEALAERGFIHAPMVDTGAPVRQVVEVFPHPAMIAIFDLARTLKYKVKQGRTRATLETEWARYQALLLSLRTADPPLHGHEQFVGQAIAGLRGRALKNYEDQVDALMCAYICLYAHRWGAARCRVFGTIEGGYIFTPVPESMRTA